MQLKIEDHCSLQTVLHDEDKKREVLHTSSILFGTEDRFRKNNRQIAVDKIPGPL